jgi:hypothetical protein
MLLLREQLLEAGGQVVGRPELSATSDRRLLGGELRFPLGRSLDALGEVVHGRRHGGDAPLLAGPARLGAHEVADEPEHGDREDGGDPDDRRAELLDPGPWRELELRLPRLGRRGRRLHQRPPAATRAKPRFAIFTALRDRPTPLTSSPRSKSPSTTIQEPVIR